MNRTEALARVLARGQHDPLYFVRNMYSWGEPGPLQNFDGPRQWQAEILEAIGDHLRSQKRFDPLRISVASGHGIGKSALMAWLTQWGISTMTDAKGVITANTEGQLRTKTWPEMRTWLSRSMLEPEFILDGTVFRSSDKAHRMTWRMDAIPWSESNPEAFAGMHNMGRRILVLFDEASAIADKIWEVVEGALTDADTEIIWVAFGNPTRPTGRFYQTHTTHSHRWQSRQIDSRTVPGTNKQQLGEWVADYGEDSDFVRVRVRGMFPKSAANQLIDTETVRAAQAKDGEILPRLTAPLIMGIDVAREGDDESTIVFRKGSVAGVHGITRELTMKPLDFAQNRIIPLINEYKPHYVHVDGGGPGGVMIDFLHNQGYWVDEIAFGGSSPNEDYANMRAWMWTQMKAWFETGVVSIPWDCEELVLQLIQQTFAYQENRTNALKLTPKAQMKSDGLSSPDIADALALTFARDVSPVAAGVQGESGVAQVARTEYSPGWR